MPTFLGVTSENMSLKERVVIIEFPFSFIDSDSLIAANPTKFKKRRNEVKQMFQLPIFRHAFFKMLLPYVGTVLTCPKSVEMANLRYFSAEGDELGNWFKENYMLEERVMGAKHSTLNVKDIYTHFKEFFGSKMGFNGFVLALTALCGKRVDNGPGFYVNRNDRMLQGYVKCVDVADATDAAAAVPEVSLLDALLARLNDMESTVSDVVDTSNGGGQMDAYEED